MLEDDAPSVHRHAGCSWLLGLIKSVAGYQFQSFISFIECRQRDVIKRILRHCGLWEGPLCTLASALGPAGRPSQVSEPRCDLELVLDPEFL
jgi:hypothetical protein